MSGSKLPSPPAAPYAEVLVANTWDCNLRCSYCFVSRNDLKTAGRRMQPATAERLVDALDQGLPEADTICIHLYGGEPLLNLPVIRTLVSKATRKPGRRFDFAITTSGTVISDEVFELLAEGQFYVILSIDGPAQVHDACRRTTDGRPTHATAVRFLDQLKRRTRCRVWGSSVVRSGWSLAEAEDYLRSLPVDAIKAQAVRAPAWSSLALTASERRGYLDHLADVGQMVIEDLEAGRRPRDSRFTSRVLQLLTGVARQRFCDAGFSSFGITPDGTVLGCLLLGADKCRIGHIDADPCTWRQAGARWAGSASPRSECSACNANPLCGGGCPAITPICGEAECEIVRANCDVSQGIFDHFKDYPEALLGLVGVF